MDMPIKDLCNSINDMDMEHITEKKELQYIRENGMKINNNKTAKFFEILS